MAQEQKRDQMVRLPNPSAQPFVAALKTARFFAVLFFWVTMVCVLAHATTFFLMEWFGLYDVPAAEARAVPVPGSAVETWLGLFEGTALAADPGELFPNVEPSLKSRKPAPSKPAAEESVADEAPAPAPSDSPAYRILCRQPSRPRYGHSADPNPDTTASLSGSTPAAPPRTAA